MQRYNSLVYNTKTRWALGSILQQRANVRLSHLRPHHDCWPLLSILAFCCSHMLLAACCSWCCWLAPPAAGSASCWLTDEQLLASGCFGLFCFCLRLVRIDAAASRAAAGLLAAAGANWHWIRTFFDLYMILWFWSEKRLQIVFRLFGKPLVWLWFRLFGYVFAYLVTVSLIWLFCRLSGYRIS